MIWIILIKPVKELSHKCQSYIYIYIFTVVSGPNLILVSMIDQFDHQRPIIPKKMKKIKSLIKKHKYSSFIFRDQFMSKQSLAKKSLLGATLGNNPIIQRVFPSPKGGSDLKEPLIDNRSVMVN